jgi:microcystin-dependent protein
MGDPFLGEIKIVGWQNAPRGWAKCEGQFLPINQNQALFALLGTTYGGNGQTTFALPDLRGRVPIHVADGFNQGQTGGETSHTITMNEMPAHNHFVNAANVTATSNEVTGNNLAVVNAKLYAPPTTQPLVTMHPSAVTNVGGSQTHNNMMPTLTLNFIIALIGVFPSRN